MYKHKLYLFGFISAAVLIIALAGVAVSAQITKENLRQSVTAQTLLSEHQMLSSISYRLFKQLTDELIFGRNANQALVRNKRQMIEESLRVIRDLEVQQREELGPDVTQGSVEDTDELEALIGEIITEFNEVIALNDQTPSASRSACNSCWNTQSTINSAKPSMPQCPARAGWYLRPTPVSKLLTVPLSGSA
ncbi:hypothetical protein [Thalassolituus sp.]|uniref:hypothetical protein n=1 Tax=Thalassolituus sp. TaxID=2030822 RepID=UPI0035135A54